MSKPSTNFNAYSLYSLEGQTAIVTGGASGLGLAIIESMVGLGAKVVVLSTRSPKEAAQSLESFGDRVAFYQFDVTQTDKSQALVDQIIAEHGPVSILVNNAGVHCKKFIWDMSVEDYESVLKVHLVGAFALTKAVVPHMKQQGHGSILFMASISSYIGQPQVTGYSTAKSGYLGLVHTLTAECAEYGIRVNAIMPGWIDTPMFRKVVENDPARMTKIMNRIPAKAIGDPMDIGMCAAFLCSDAAKYINGACIPVDGGALIGF